MIKETNEKAEHIIKIDLPKKICSLNEYIEV